MSLRALLYAYLLGGLTFIPLLVLSFLFIAIYSSVPANAHNIEPEQKREQPPDDPIELARARKGWLTVRRTFEESPGDGSYVTFVRSYLDARSKDPKRSRPKDMWYVALKGTVMYLYEDEAMTECEAAVELGSHDVVIYPEGLLDGELFTRRNAICLKPRAKDTLGDSQSASKGSTDDLAPGDAQQSEGDHAADESLAPWFIFVRSCVDMEDWYLALVHASDHPSGTSTLDPLKPVFLPSEMNWLVSTLDEQPDVIPMRWFNALLGRVFYTFYRTQMLESYIIGRIMKKLSRVKRPAFLTDLAVTQFSVGNKAPTFSKPMLKELTKEGDASLEVGLAYTGAIRATVEATAVINLGSRFKPYSVKLVLAVVIREIQGNILVKVKRPPSTRIWYAFTKPPRMVINVEPIVSDRQITWSMILNTIESKIEETIADSVVLPNMDDISFFDSSQYEHRGGVWADAGRLDKLMTPEAVPKPLVDEPGSPTFSRVHTEPEPEPASAESVPIIRPASTFPDKTSSSVRRRSWFVPSADAELGGPSRQMEQQVVHDVNPTPLPPAPDPLPPLEVSEDEQDPLSPTSHPPSRSSRAHSVSSSAGGDECNYLSDTSVTSKGPRQPLGTTSSFLSTLKSKAGDKQALSNTAKEAMRKWGVNWGLKKDAGGNPSLDDLVGVDHPCRVDSTHGRQNYADVRAAVIERREREHPERVNGNSSPIPIPAAGGGEKGRSVSVPGGGRLTPSYSSNGSTSSGLPRSVGDAPNGPFAEDVDEDAVPSLIHTQPLQARTMTIPGIHASHRGEVMSMGNIAPSVPVAESKLKGSGIQSMYRLWKSPTTSGRGEENNDGNQDVTPLSLTPEMVPPRAVPPPLPPRNVSSVAMMKHESEAMDAGVSAAVSATKRDVNETRRVSTELEGGEPTRATKPPLPPRRVAG